MLPYSPVDLLRMMANRTDGAINGSGCTEEIAEARSSWNPFKRATRRTVWVPSTTVR